MAKGMSKQTRIELLTALRSRYGSSTKREKTRILDEVVSLLGCHRKHAIRLLRGGPASPATVARVGRRVYDEAVREALVVAWEASDRLCGKRLVRVLATLVESLESHGRLSLDAGVRERLLDASPSTIDRLLSPVRSAAAGRKKRRRTPTKPSREVPTRTFADWNDPRPGHLEIDLVAHCGSSASGSFVHSLVATDVHSGWTEAVALLAREESLVVEGLEVIRARLPVPMLGIDTDNDSAFINDTLLSYSESRGLEFTRSRPYRKNDQAWVEQKNGAVIRRFAGHARRCGAVAGRTLASLYESALPFVNFFQPSFRLREKTRVGSRVRKSYFDPATPCERLLTHESVAEERKAALRRTRADLDPVALLHRVREAQSALAALDSGESCSAPERRSLDQFLAALPHLWRSGDPRPTHRGTAEKPRHWRTRRDPFEGVWSTVLSWLQDAPDATAKSLFERLRRDHPGKFSSGQLRTLQRRVREWRHVMARELVHSCIPASDPPANDEPARSA